MRLIDADELLEHVWRDKLDSRELIAKMIDNAPTVKEIPMKMPLSVFEQLIPKQARRLVLIEELAKEDPQVLSLAYVYAKNQHMYGNDVTEKWETATQNASALEKAYRRGYYDALQRQAESEEIK